MTHSPFKIAQNELKSLMSTKPSLLDAAGLLGVSEDHLERMIKQEYGILSDSSETVKWPLAAMNSSERQHTWR